MATSFKVGTFNKSTSAAPVAQQVEVGFEPKAYILFCTTRTADTGYTTDYLFAIGMTDGTDDFSACSYSQDAQDTTVAKRRMAQKVLTLATTSVLAECDHQSLDAPSGGFTGGFTVNWTTNDSNAYRIGYVAIGGDDITGVKLAEYLVGTATGDVDVTGAGFEPDFYFNLSAQMTGTAPAGPTDSARFSWGAACRDGTQGYMVGASNPNLGTSSTARAGWNDNSLVFLDGAGGKAQGAADHVSMLSDGHRQNWAIAPAANYRAAVLWIKGGNWTIDAATTPSSTGDEAITGVGFGPRGILNWSHNEDTAGSQSHNRLTFGGASGAGSEAAMWAGDVSAVGTSESDRAYSNARNIIINDNGSPTVAQEDALLTSLDADGWTNNWQTATATAILYTWLAVGDSPPASATRRVYTTTMI